MKYNLKSGKFTSILSFDNFPSCGGCKLEGNCFQNSSGALLPYLLRTGMFLYLRSCYRFEIVGYKSPFRFYRRKSKFYCKILIYKVSILGKYIVTNVTGRENWSINSFCQLCPVNILANALDILTYKDMNSCKWNVANFTWIENNFLIL